MGANVEVTGRHENSVGAVLNWSGRRNSEPPPDRCRDGTRPHDPHTTTATRTIVGGIRRRPVAVNVVR